VWVGQPRCLTAWYKSGLLFGIPASPPGQYLTLSLRQLGFNTFETNLLTIPSSVATIITMFGIAVVSETVHDRAIVAMMEDLWVLPFLIAIRCLPNKPDPWLYYVSDASSSCNYWANRNS